MPFRSAACWASIRKVPLCPSSEDCAGPKNGESESCCDSVRTMDGYADFGLNLRQWW
jgi:hypothetical protein